jgi:hypothetical protein
MKSLKNQSGVSLSAIATVVAHSPIMVERPVHPLARLPYGFERTDISILDWIITARVANRASSFAN